MYGNNIFIYLLNMTIAGHILDLYCVHKKVPFLANIERCPKFLEYALYSYFMLNKFILMQCRNFKIMWLIITDEVLFQHLMVIVFQMIFC